MLEMYTTQDQLQAQWEAMKGREGTPEQYAFALARFAEARAIVAARRIISEKDEVIKRLEGERSRLHNVGEG